MSIISLEAYRQRLAEVEREALAMNDEELELYAIDGDLEDDGIDWMETARAGLSPPLYCVKRENGKNR